MKEHRQSQADQEQPAERLSMLLHRLVLMRETGPKSARWERARRATIWRLLQQIEQRDPRRQ